MASQNPVNSHNDDTAANLNDYDYENELDDELDDYEFEDEKAALLEPRNEGQQQSKKKRVPFAGDPEDYELIKQRFYQLLSSRIPLHFRNLSFREMRGRRDVDLKSTLNAKDGLLIEAN